MFNPFKKGETSVKVIDKIWMSEVLEYDGILDLWKKKLDLATICGLMTLMKYSPEAG